ncbi:hypothetical protein HDU67_000304 [Dinochytrium kinnereticum]|nr:hypothetical protein HDU67_000304 [Dinochytrium kinnereticum]
MVTYQYNERSNLQDPKSAPVVIGALVGYAIFWTLSVTWFLLWRHKRSIRNRAVVLTFLQGIMGNIILWMSLYERIMKYPVCFPKIRLLGMIDRSQPADVAQQQFLPPSDAQKLSFSESHKCSTSINLSTMVLDSQAEEKSWTKAADDMVDRWLVRRKRGVSEASIMRILLIFQIPIFVYLAIAQIFTKTHRVYPVIDAGGCTYGTLEYVLFFVVPPSARFTSWQEILSLLHVLEW